MRSAELSKKCREYNKEYKAMFGYIPCPRDYKCNNEDFFDALVKAVETKTEIDNFLEKQVFDYSNPNILY